MQSAHRWNKHATFALSRCLSADNRGQNFHLASFTQLRPARESRNTNQLATTTNQRKRMNAPVITSATIQNKSMLNQV
jgi:hypothetical protein